MLSIDVMSSVGCQLTLLYVVQTAQKIKIKKIKWQSNTLRNLKSHYHSTASGGLWLQLAFTRFLGVTTAGRDLNSQPLARVAGRRK